MQNFTAVGRLRRLKETKMWQNRDLGLDPGLNSHELFNGAVCEAPRKVVIFSLVNTKIIVRKLCEGEHYNFQLNE